MRYIHTLEEKKFKEEKEKENELLRKFGVDEKIIQDLYEFDRAMFNKNRSFSEHEVYIETQYLNPYRKCQLVIYDVSSMDTVDDVKYELCVIYPVKIVAQIDESAMEVILLRLKGYTYEEIAKLQDMTLEQVKYIFKKVRRILK